jgi:hypothetical protein
MSNVNLDWRLNSSYEFRFFNQEMQKSLDFETESIFLIKIYKIMILMKILINSRPFKCLDLRGHYLNSDKIMIGLRIFNIIKQYSRLNLRLLPEDIEYKFWKMKAEYYKKERIYLACI